jgi:prevent-host-death family protein
MAKQPKTNASAQATRAPHIPAGEFKARCLQIMDEVHATHRPVVITKYGKPVAKLVPADDEVPDSFGGLQGSVRYHGDIVAPDHESWDDAPA